MLKHELFEELAALQATGQLSANEQRRLDEHLVDCESCRSASAEFSAILRELPADGQSVDKAVLHRVQQGAFRERFFERARADGRRFSEQAQQGTKSGRLRFPRAVPAYQWVAAAVSLAVLVDATAHLHARRPVSASPPAVSQRDDTDGVAAKFALLQSANEAAGRATASLTNENAALLARMETLERQLAADESEKQNLERTVVHVSETNAQLGAETDHNTQLLAQTKEELERISSDRTATEAELAADRAELGELSEQVRLQTASLDQDRDLLKARRDITDLMGARNLHIIDVRDADGNGKDRRSFGRVFYTEGKSLIFYAFDLDDKKVETAKYSFEAWGEQLGQTTPVKSLGVFYMDDKQQKRWVLKVNDPRRLAEIDSVFVTLEPQGSADGKPRGNRILYAFLSGQPNHP